MPAKFTTWRPPHAITKAAATKVYNDRRRDKRLLALYSSKAWKAFRALIRHDRVWCELCLTQGRRTVGILCHHLVDPRLQPDGLLDPSNIQLLCRPCHNNVHALKNPR